MIGASLACAVGLSAASTPVLRRVGHTESRLTGQWWHVPVAALLGLVMGIGADRWWQVALVGLLASFGAILVLVDLAEFRLPDAIVLPGYPVLTVILTGVAWAEGAWPRLLTALAVATVCFVLFLAMAWFAGGGLGMGDVKLTGVLGLVVGWHGWQAAAVALGTAVIANGLIAAAVLLVTRDRKREVPFGPALIAGAAVALMLGA